MRPNPFVAICIYLVVFGAFMYGAWLLYEQLKAPLPETNTETMTESGAEPVATSTEAESEAPIVAAAQNGQTVTIAESSRFTVTLPEALYDIHSLTVTPSDALGETFGAKVTPGMWARTFEAVKKGTATLTVTPKSASTTPFKLTIITK